MLLARYRALIQETNIGLVKIRHMEVLYFASFFMNVATQASVLAGVIMGTLSQTPGLAASCAYIWKFFYFVGSALVVVFSIQSFLAAVFSTVYGQGFALRGPIGSMVDTVDGLVAEQELIVCSYLLNVFFFVVMQEVGMFFINMDTTQAIGTSLFVCVFLLYTFHRLYRIYSRFYWVKTSSWDKESSVDPLELVEIARVESAEDIEGQRVGGYLSLKTRQKFGLDPWKRVYVVVHQQKLNYYKDKEAFESRVASPLNTHQIDVSAFCLLTEMKGLSFLLWLDPLDADDPRRGWKFRCDTGAEYLKWVEVLTANGAVLEDTGGRSLSFGSTASTVSDKTYVTSVPNVIVLSKVTVEPSVAPLNSWGTADLSLFYKKENLKGRKNMNKNVYQSPLYEAVSVEIYSTDQRRDHFVRTLTLPDSSLMNTHLDIIPHILVLNLQIPAQLGNKLILDDGPTWSVVLVFQITQDTCDQVTDLSSAPSVVSNFVNWCEDVRDKTEKHCLEKIKIVSTCSNKDQIKLPRSTTQHDNNPLPIHQISSLHHGSQGSHVHRHRHQATRYIEIDVNLLKLGTEKQKDLQSVTSRCSQMLLQTGVLLSSGEGGEDMGLIAGVALNKPQLL